MKRQAHCKSSPSFDLTGEAPITSNIIAPKGIDLSWTAKQYSTNTWLQITERPLNNNGHKKKKYLHQISVTPFR